MGIERNKEITQWRRCGGARIVCSSNVRHRTQLRGCFIWPEHCLKGAVHKLPSLFNLWTDKTIHVNLYKKLSNRSQKEWPVLLQTIRALPQWRHWVVSLLRSMPIVPYGCYFCHEFVTIFFPYFSIQSPFTIPTFIEKSLYNLCRLLSLVY